MNSKPKFKINQIVYMLNISPNANKYDLIMQAYRIEKVLISKKEVFCNLFGKRNKVSESELFTLKELLEIIKFIHDYNNENLNPLHQKKASLDMETNNRKESIDKL